MIRATPEQWLAAFEQAGSSAGAASADPLVSSARKIVAARRAGRDGEGCPVGVLRRVQGFYVGRPRGVVGRLLEMVFDSGFVPAPAMRGARRAPRTFRFQGDGATIDLQVRSTESGGRTLHVAMVPPRPGISFEVRPLPGGPRRRVALDASATGEVALPPRARRVSAAFKASGGEIFRIGEVAVE